MLRLSRLVLVLFTLVAFWPTFALAQTKAGVVTTLQGSATAARAALPQPVALKFKDDIFLNDRIVTGDQSIVRMLLGGKAVVTVRERSSLTITEVPGKSTIDLDVGKIAVAVAKEKMRPGESIEVKTPNAVAAVRGTVFVVEVLRTTASADAAQLGVHTNIFVFVGQLLATFLSGQQFTLGPGNFAGALGANPANVGTMTADQKQNAQAGLTPQAQNASGGQDNAKQASQAQTVALSNVLGGLLETPTEPPPVTPPTPSTPKADLLPGGKEIESPVPVPTPGGGLLINPGFETGDLTGWTLGGAGTVISALGSIRPPEGRYMAIIHTGTGAIVNTTSFLTSSNIDSGHVFLVKAKYNFLSNEFPTRSTTFNDTFRIFVTDSNEVQTLLRTETRNTSFTMETVSPETATAGGFTIDAGKGVTGFKSLSQTVVSTGTGLFGVTFEIFDVDDTNVDSAALIDAAVVTEDPPLYFLRNGATLTRTTSEPLLKLTGTSERFDSLMVVCCQSSVSLGGPLLEATNSNLTVAFSLLTVVQDGSFTTTSTAPLVSLTGGTSTLGAEVGVFDLAGTRTAVDPQTGLTLGTDRPLQHGGVLLETTGATIDTQSVLKVDTALLEATAPLLNLKGGSILTTSSHTVDLSGRAKVSIPNDAAAMIGLNASALTVRNGHLVNLAGGSVLNVAGTLVSLANASTLNILNGLLLNLSGGSVASIGKSLVSFSGSGNVLNVTNNFVPTALIAGVPVYGPADSFKISGNALTGLGTAGTIKINGVALTPTTPLSSLKGSLVAVQGGGSLKIGP